MNSKSKQPILVTGSHRSGSTWVGRVISAHSGVCYVDEPVKPENAPDFLHNGFNISFAYITGEWHRRFLQGYKKLLTGNFPGLSDISHLTYRNWLKYFVYFRLIAGIKRQRYLLKDPFAIFSSEWFDRYLRSKNIILIRHPAAFVSSLKKNGWTHDFNSFLRQPELIRDHLPAYREEIMKCIEENYDVIDQGILFWNLFHSYILKMKEKHPDWYFVRHEDLSVNPFDEFQRVFQYLELSFSAKVQAYLRSTTSEENRSERPDNISHVLKRNSKANIKNWKKRLTGNEIEKIHEQTKAVSSYFYSPEEWN